MRYEGTFFGLWSLLMLLCAFVALKWVFAGGIGAAQTTPPAPQTFQGRVATWTLPESGWRSYGFRHLSVLGLDIDECVEQEGRNRVVCLNVLGTETAGDPKRALVALYDQFGIPEADRPRITVSRDGRASFEFDLDAGFVEDKMRIKVSCAPVPGRAGKLLMVYGAWKRDANTTAGSADFDAIAARVRLR